MRVLLHINSLAVGGAERVLLKLASHWHGLGHDVLVVTQVPVEQDQLPVPPGVLRISTQTGRVSRHWLVALMSNVQRARRLRAVLREWQPDCIVAFLPTANVVALLAARGLGIPVVVGERMFPAFLGLGWLQRYARDRQYPHAAAVVVQTEESATWYHRTLALANLVVIPNGISLPLADQAPHVEPDSVLASSARVVLCIGRMAEPKQPEDAVQAFATAFADNPEWHLVLIGDGDKQPHVQAMIASSQLAERIHWIARAGNVATWYRRAQICVSVSAAEGFPNVLLEAMAMGCVPVAYDCSTGPREVIRDGINGYLVPVGDIASLSLRMQKLGMDEALRAQLAHAAQAVTDSHSDAAFYSRWDAVLAQVASAQR